MNQSGPTRHGDPARPIPTPRPGTRPSQLLGDRLERTRMYKHILISTDGSEVAQKGVDHGLSLAKSLKARVTIIMVTEGFPIYSDAGITGAWVPGPAEMAQY